MSSPESVSSRRNEHYTYPESPSWQSKILTAGLQVSGYKKRINSLTRENISKQSVPPPKTLERTGRLTKLDENTSLLIPECSSERESHVFYLHGGAYAWGMTKFHWRFVEKLSDEAKANVVIPDYPLAPKATYREVFDTILPRYKNLANSVGNDNLTIMGDSAGGGMALALAQKLRDENYPQPKNIVLVSPWLDVGLKNKRISDIADRDPMLGIDVLRLAGSLYADGDIENPLASPGRRSIQNLARLSLYFAGRDILAPDALALRERMMKEDIPGDSYYYPETLHAWPLFTWLPEAKFALQSMASTIKLPRI